MSHYTVLVIGENVEDQLDPFWELDLPREELINDTRAEFTEEISVEDLENEFEKFKLEGHDKEYESAREFAEEWNGYCLNKEGTAYGYYRNPNAKWDWYSIGGRWSGFFKLKPGRTGKVGEKGLGSKTTKFGYVDSAYLRDIDIEGMREEEGEKARIYYRDVETIFGGSIPKIDIFWDDIVNEESYSHLSAQEKRDLYWNQKSNLKLLEIRKSEKLTKDQRDVVFWLKLDDVQISIEEYVNNAKRKAIQPYAVLKDGEWYERGEMGWFGISNNEKNPDDWEEEFNELLNNLPEDTLLTIVDCHI